MKRKSVARLLPIRVVAIVVLICLFLSGFGQETVFGKCEKTLFLGNSITHHGPSPTIGWYGDWGMAASSADKDYAHRVVTSIGAVEGVEPTMMIGSALGFEVGYTPTFDFSGIPTGNWAQAYCIDGGVTVNLTSEQFSRYFSPYQVQTYRLIHAPEPTALAFAVSGLGLCFLLRRRYRKALA